MSTFAAPVVAGVVIAFLGVLLAGRRLRQELQRKDARHYFLDEGLLKLSAAYEQMLGAARVNYAVSTDLLRILRDWDPQDSVPLRPDDLPQLMPAITDVTAFAAIGPSRRMAGWTELGDLATEAFVRLLNFNVWLPRLLRALAVRSTEIGLDSFSDLKRIDKDAEITSLRNRLKALLDQVQDVRPSETRTEQ